MRADLIIRPGIQDHRLMADLLAPGGPGRMRGSQPLISRVILDANVAPARPGIARAARSVGVPVAVDPQTFYIQYELAGSTTWTGLSFGTARAISPDEAFEALRHGNLIEQVVRFQLDHGASVIIPPYFHASSPNDPWFEVTLEAITRTRFFLDRWGIRLPLFPVLSARLDRFAPSETWPDGIDRFVDICHLGGARSIGAQLGPAGRTNDGYARVFNVLTSLQRLQNGEQRVIALRLGMYAAPLSAIGVAGVETGVEYGDATDVLSLVANRRKPPAAEKRGGSGGRIYIPRFGRWIKRDTYEALAESVASRALVVCDDPVDCCLEGPESTLRDRRGHAIRSRARALDALDSLPAQSWRLLHVENQARDMLSNVRRANLVLERLGRLPLNDSGLDALARVSEFIRHDVSAAA